MKKFICMALCLLMITVAFTGCFGKGKADPQTFEEAARIEKDFIKNDKLKNVECVTEIKGISPFEGVKLVLEGKYDHKTQSGLFSLSFKSNGMSYTFDDLIRLSGRNLYIKLPDVSSYLDMMGSMYGAYPSASPSYTFGTEQSAALPLDAYNYGYDAAYNMMKQISGKNLLIKLPETKTDTIKTIFEEAEQAVYEKARPLDAEENYPFVTEYTTENIRSLLVYVLDGVKSKKSALIDEIKALALEYFGSKICGEKSFDGRTFLDELGDGLSEGIDSFFNNFNAEDIDLGNEGDLKITQKTSYESDKKCEYVIVCEFKDGDKTESVTTTITITPAEEDNDFASKCAVDESEAFDVFGYYRTEMENMLDQLKLYDGSFSY